MKPASWYVYHLFILVQLLSFSKCAYPQYDMWYPRYHLASINGFMNDPNGLIFHDGYYHAFFQHTPKDVSPGGLKNWAHARSRNMLEWEHLSEALTPSIAADIGGCFSGSAVLDKKGIVNLVYTGVSTVNGKAHQVQCLAYQNYLTYVKRGKIIENSTYFENFRDPKVWEQEDFYYVVIAATNQTNNTDQGQIVLYKSIDLTNWEPQGILLGPLNNTVTECPDLYTINDKQILSFSFQEPHPNGSVGYKSGYMIGTWKPGKKFEIEQTFHEFDKGHDFYASQTFLAPDGRRIQMAWMNMWDTPFPDGKQFGWVGSLTLPRELTINDKGVLVANPIKEVETLRGDMIHHFSMVLFEDQKVLRLQSSSSENRYFLAYELLLEWNIKNSNATEFGIRLIADELSGEGLYIFVSKDAGRLVLRRNYPNYGFPLSDRSVNVDVNANLFTRIFIDFSTVEVFINNGEDVMSSRIYPNGIQRNLEMYTKGGDAVFNNFCNWAILENTV